MPCCSAGGSSIVDALALPQADRTPSIRVCLISGSPHTGPPAIPEGVDASSLAASRGGGRRCSYDAERHGAGAPVSGTVSATHLPAPELEATVAHYNAFAGAS